MAENAPSETFTATNDFGRDEYRIEMSANGNGWVSFDVWSRWGGNDAEGNACEQEAQIGLKNDEALRLAHWIIENLPTRTPRP